MLILQKQNVNKVKPPLPQLGSPRESFESRNEERKSSINNKNVKEIKSVTKATASEPVSHISSKNFLNSPYEESKEEDV